MLADVTLKSASHDDGSAGADVVPLVIELGDADGLLAEDGVHPGRHLRLSVSAVSHAHSLVGRRPAHHCPPLLGAGGALLSRLPD